jgi:hypothetical protein
VNIGYILILKERMINKAMKTKKCIRCGVPLHSTDWLILKDMNTLPICDNCSLDEVNKKNVIQYKLIKGKKDKRV